ncbi:MAG TPA: IclR family transcriptional regulator [Casimicrobiaceae bacterium]|nr:IclR family transcriptional regulator [Casimicrobiaceae bacterium]
MQTSSSRTRNQLIASAAATLEVLEALGSSDAPLPLAAIVALTGRPKGSVHRMVSTLVNTGFVQQDDASGRYSLTLKAWRIGASAIRRLDLVERARPILDRLVGATGETVHLAVLDPSGGVVYVAKVESPKSIGVQTRLGQMNPSWCTATGRSLLAFNVPIAERVLSCRLDKRTPKTITDPRVIRTRLAEVRTNGYAVTLAENHPEMGGVAAPVRDHDGVVVAALGVAIPQYRMDAAATKRAIPNVLRAASELSHALGHHTVSKRSAVRAA